MKVLVVYAHPRRESLCAAALERTLSALASAGHEVELRDLYESGFDPVVSRGEYLLGRQAEVGTSAVAPDLRLLSWAEALVFVYPTWWGGQPAILKGWLDRVIVAGGARAPGRTRTDGAPRLRNIRRIVVVTTHGSSKSVNSFQGEPGKRVLLRGLRLLAHPLARSRWIAAYGLDRSTATEREAFLDRVERRLGRI